MSRPDPLPPDPPGAAHGRVVISWFGVDRTDIDLCVPRDAATTKDARPDRTATMVVIRTRQSQERTSVIEVLVDTPEGTPSLTPDRESDRRWSDAPLNDHLEHVTEVPLVPMSEGRHRSPRRPRPDRHAADSLAQERSGDRSRRLTRRHLMCGTPRARRVAVVLAAAVAALCVIASIGRPSNSDAVVASRQPSTTTTSAGGAHKIDTAAGESTFAPSECQALSGPGWIGGLYINAAAPSTDTPHTTNTTFSPADCLPTAPQECPPDPQPSRDHG